MDSCIPEGRKKRRVEWREKLKLARVSAKTIFTRENSGIFYYGEVWGEIIPRESRDMRSALKEI